jgi:hypothetical protein
MHKRTLAVVATIAIALIAIAPSRVAGADVDATLALFERYLEALRRIARVPGMSAVILRDSRPI